MDVQQGNVLKAEMVQRLKVGMSKDQVRDIMGTPALSHSLNTNRWDYYYFFKPGNGDPTVEKSFSVFFSGGKVVRWEGNF
jgi:outer membrane protein assembly factor BamE